MRCVFVLAIVCCILVGCGYNPQSSEEPIVTSTSIPDSIAPIETEVLPSQTPTEKPRKTIYLDIPYVEDGYRNQRLSIYLPDEVVDHPDAIYPTVFLAHAWNGSPDASPQKELIEFLRELGYASVTIHYRMGENDGGPWTALSDGYCALAWVYLNAEEYGLDVERMIAFGNSFGATTVSIIGMTDEMDLFRGDCPYELKITDPFKGVIIYGGSFFGIPGPEMVFGTDVHANMLEEVNYGKASEIVSIAQALSAFSPSKWSEIELPPEQRRFVQIQPSYWVHPGAPPFLIIHPELDRWQPVESEAFVAMLEGADVPVTYLLLPGARHMQWNQLDSLTWQTTVQQFIKGIFEDEI